jgi:hypothetical protein
MSVQLPRHFIGQSGDISTLVKHLAQDKIRALCHELLGLTFKMDAQSVIIGLHEEDLVLTVFGHLEVSHVDAQRTEVLTWARSTENSYFYTDPVLM